LEVKSPSRSSKPIMKKISSPDVCLYMCAQTPVPVDICPLFYDTPTEFISYRGVGALGLLGYVNVLRNAINRRWSIFRLQINTRLAATLNPYPIQTGTCFGDQPTHRKSIAIRREANTKNDCNGVHANPMSPTYKSCLVRNTRPPSPPPFPVLVSALGEVRHNHSRTLEIRHSWHPYFVFVTFPNL